MAAGAARSVVAALAEPSGWTGGGGRQAIPAIPALELAAILLALEDRAEELYREANGRHAPNCMLATAWLYATPFCRAAADDLARRGEDLRSLKDEAIGARRRGGDVLAASGRDWLV